MAKTAFSIMIFSPIEMLLNISQHYYYYLGNYVGCTRHIPLQKYLWN